MTWMRLDETVREHLKIGRLARGLGVSRPTAIGHLVCLWTWALKNASDGDLGDITDDELAEAAQWDGDASKLTRELVSNRLLDKSDDGLSIHDWMEHAEGLKIAKRQQQRRRRMKRDSHASVTHQSRNRSVIVASDGTGRDETGREKRVSPVGETLAPSSAVADSAPPVEPRSPALVIEDPVVETFAVVGGSEWPLRASLAQALREGCPGVDFEGELRSAKTWCLTAGPKRKTAAGMPRFLRTWLDKAQNRAASAPPWQRGAQPPQPRRLSVAEAQLAESRAVVDAMRERVESRARGDPPPEQHAFTLEAQARQISEDQHR